MRDGSRLVLGATTVALIGLATVGTSVLVDNGTKTLNPEQSAPPPRTVSSPAPAPGPLVVARPAGTFVPPSGLLAGPRPVVPPAQLVALGPLPVVPVAPAPGANGPAMVPRVRPGTGVVAEPAPTPTPTPTPTEPSDEDGHGKAHTPRPAHSKPDHPEHPAHPTPHPKKKQHDRG